MRSYRKTGDETARANVSWEGGMVDRARKCVGEEDQEGAGVGLRLARDRREDPRQGRAPEEQAEERARLRNPPDLCHRELPEHRAHPFWPPDCPIPIKSRSGENKREPDARGGPTRMANVSLWTDRGKTISRGSSRREPLPTERIRRGPRGRLSQSPN